MMTKFYALQWAQIQGIVGPDKYGFSLYTELNKAAALIEDRWSKLGETPYYIATGARRYTSHGAKVFTEIWEIELSENSTLFEKIEQFPSGELEFIGFNTNAETKAIAMKIRNAESALFDSKTVEFFPA